MPPRAGERSRAATRPPSSGSRQIIVRLDSGQAELRETLELCREGKSLVEYCKGELDAVSGELQRLDLDDLVRKLEAGAGDEEPAAGSPAAPAADDR